MRELVMENHHRNGIITYVLSCIPQKDAADDKNNDTDNHRKILMCTEKAYGLNSKTTKHYLSKEAVQ